MQSRRRNSSSGSGVFAATGGNNLNTDSVMGMHGGSDSVNERSTNSVLRASANPDPERAIGGRALPLELLAKQLSQLKMQWELCKPPRVAPGATSTGVSSSRGSSPTLKRRDPNAIMSRQSSGMGPSHKAGSKLSFKSAAKAVGSVQMAKAMQVASQQGVTDAKGKLRKDIEHYHQLLLQRLYEFHEQLSLDLPSTQAVEELTVEAMGSLLKNLNKRLERNQLINTKVSEAEKLGFSFADTVKELDDHAQQPVQLQQRKGLSAHQVQKHLQTRRSTSLEKFRNSLLDVLTEYEALAHHYEYDAEAEQAGRIYLVDYPPVPMGSGPSELSVGICKTIHLPTTLEQILSQLRRAPGVAKFLGYEVLNSGPLLLDFAKAPKRFARCPSMSPSLHRTDSGISNLRATTGTASSGGGGAPPRATLGGVHVDTASMADSLSEIPSNSVSPCTTPGDRPLPTPSAKRLPSGLSTPGHKKKEKENVLWSSISVSKMEQVLAVSALWSRLTKKVLKDQPPTSVPFEERYVSFDEGANSRSQPQRQIRGGRTAPPVAGGRHYARNEKLEREFHAKRAESHSKWRGKFPSQEQHLSPEEPTSSDQIRTEGTIAFDDFATSSDAPIINLHTPEQEVLPVFGFAADSNQPNASASCLEGSESVLGPSPESQHRRVTMAFELSAEPPATAQASGGSSAAFSPQTTPRGNEVDGSTPLGAVYPMPTVLGHSGSMTTTPSNFFLSPSGSLGSQPSSPRTTPRTKSITGEMESSLRAGGLSGSSREAGTLSRKSSFGGSMSGSSPTGESAVDKMRRVASGVSRKRSFVLSKSKAQVDDRAKQREAEEATAKAEHEAAEARRRQQLEEMRRRRATRVMGVFALSSLKKIQEAKFQRDKAHELALQAEFPILTQEDYKRIAFDKLTPMEQRCAGHKKNPSAIVACNRIKGFFRNILVCKPCRYGLSLLRWDEKSWRAVTIISEWWSSALKQRKNEAHFRQHWNSLQHKRRRLLQAEIKKFDTGVLDLQRTLRGFLCRQALCTMNIDTTYQTQVEALRRACWMLTSSRQIRVLRFAQQEKHEHAILRDKQHRACIHVQRVFRGMLGRRRALAASQVRMLDLDFAMKRSKKILARAARWFRANAETRKNRLHKFEQQHQEALEELRWCNAARIQRSWKMHAAKKELLRLLDEERERKRKALALIPKGTVVKTKVQKSIRKIDHWYVDRLCTKAVEGALGDGTSHDVSSSLLFQREANRHSKLTTDDVPVLVPPATVSQLANHNVSYSLFENTTGLFAISMAADAAKKDLKTLAVEQLLLLPQPVVFTLAALCCKAPGSEAPVPEAKGVEEEEQEEQQQQQQPDDDGLSPSPEAVSPPPRPKSRLTRGGSDDDCDDDEVEGADLSPVPFAEDSNDRDAHDTFDTSESGLLNCKTGEGLPLSLTQSEEVDDASDTSSDEGSEDEDDDQEPQAKKVEAANPAPRVDDDDDTKRPPQYRKPYSQWNNANDLVERMVAYGVEWACNMLLPWSNNCAESMYYYDDPEEQASTEEFMLATFGCDSADEWVSLVISDLDLFNRFGDRSTKRQASEQGLSEADFESSEEYAASQQRDKGIRSARFLQEMAPIVFGVRSLYDVENVIIIRGLENMIRSAFRKHPVNVSHIVNVLNSVAVASNATASLSAARSRTPTSPGRGSTSGRTSTSTTPRSQISSPVSASLFPPAPGASKMDPKAALVIQTAMTQLSRVGSLSVEHAARMSNSVAVAAAAYILKGVPQPDLAQPQQDASPHRSHSGEHDSSIDDSSSSLGGTPPMLRSHDSSELDATM